MKNQLGLLLIIALPFLIGCTARTEVNNTLTEEELNEGWSLLFDGSSVEGWRGYNQETLPAAWTAEEGTLMSSGEGHDIGGDIIFEKEEFCNFELKLDWKIAQGGNSGIMYHSLEGEQYKAPYETAPEYQLIDDMGFGQPLEEWQKTGADYAMHPADPAELIIKPAEEWNSTRILFDNGHVEHWLNGKKVVEFEAWTEEWKTEASEGKWKDYPEYGLSKCGYIVLQDHGSYIWFRNIKIRKLD